MKLPIIESYQNSYWRQSGQISPFSDMRLYEEPLDVLVIVANNIRQYKEYLHNYFIKRDCISETSFVASPIFEPLRYYIVEYCTRSQSLRGKKAEGFIILEPDDYYYDDRHAEHTYDLMRAAHERAYSSDIKSHQLMFSDSQYFTDGDKAHEDAYAKEDGFRLRLEHSGYSRCRGSTYSFEGLWSDIR